MGTGQCDVLRQGPSSTASGMVLRPRKMQYIQMYTYIYNVEYMCTIVYYVNIYICTYIYTYIIYIYIYYRYTDRIDIRNPIEHVLTGKVGGFSSGSSARCRWDHHGWTSYRSTYTVTYYIYINIHYITL